MKFLSLKWKISGVLILSNMLMGLLLVIIVNRTVSNSIGKELIERGRTIAINLAQYSAEQILEEDVVGLRQLVTGALNFESVEYILIHGSEGNILTDTFNRQVPPELSDKLDIEKKLSEKPEVIYLEEQAAECYDIWVPVQEGYLGYIRVGMKKNYIVKSVRNTTVTVVSAILGITLIGIIIVLVLATRIIKPILYLTRRADEISQGKLEEKVIVNTNDEIHSLGQALERLRESVKIALDRLKKHQTLRI